MIHCHNVAKIMPPHYANYDGRGIHHLQQYSGPHRGGFCQVAYESESDTESDSRGHHPLTAQQPHTETNTTQVLPTSGCFAQVAQATLKKSRSSGPPRESSGACSGSPPSPWGSGETKKRIVNALKNEHSDIHLFIGDKTCTTGCKINYAEIQKLYAPKHEMTKFRQNFKRLIESKKNMTGPFKETAKKKSNEIEPWYTSSKKTCLGYTLLHDMYLNQPNIINHMTAKEIWTSQPEFQKYPLDDFKRYNKNMKILVSNKVVRAATEEAIFQEDMRNHQHKQITCRGTLFWGEHAAKKLLIKDVDDGIGRTMKTQELWKSRKEYQAFPYEFFRKRVYEVRQKALAAPYWQVKRNKNGRELHRLQTDRMREKWAIDVEIENMTDMFKRVGM
jgi:hypothetical protein